MSAIEDTLDLSGRRCRSGLVSNRRMLQAACDEECCQEPGGC